MGSSITDELHARRVMKARKRTACAVCGRWVWQGEQIGLLDDIGWCHVACVIEAQRKAAEGSWKDTYSTQVDLEKKQQGQALAWLRTAGRRVTLETSRRV